MTTHHLAGIKAGNTFARLIDSPPTTRQVQALSAEEASLYLLAQTVLCTRPVLVGPDNLTIVSGVCALRHVCPGLELHQIEGWIDWAIAHGMAERASDGKRLAVLRHPLLTDQLHAVRAYQLGISVRAHDGATFVPRGSVPADHTDNTWAAERAVSLALLVLKQTGNKEEALADVMGMLLNPNACATELLDPLIADVLAEDTRVVQLVYHYIQGVFVQAMQLSPG